jgi:hypothetical protein
VVIFSKTRGGLRGKKLGHASCNGSLPRKRVSEHIDCCECCVRAVLHSVYTVKCCLHSACFVLSCVVLRHVSAVVYVHIKVTVMVKLSQYRPRQFLRVPGY